MKQEIIDFIGSANYQGDDLGTYIWANRPDGIRELILIVCGYNSDTEEKEGKEVAEHFQNELGKFIAKAINEKIQRDCVKVERISVRNIDMPKRLLNFFKTAEIIYLDEISEFKKYEILLFHNVGVKRLFELEQIMDKYNVKFKSE